MKSETDLRNMIKEILADDNDRMTDWEVSFIDSVNRQDRLSEKQAEIIERIWGKVFK